MDGADFQKFLSLIRATSTATGVLLLAVGATSTLTSSWVGRRVTARTTLVAFCLAFSTCEQLTVTQTRSSAVAVTGFLIFNLMGGTPSNLRRNDKPGWNPSRNPAKNQG